jgi:hypothetical protein
MVGALAFTATAQDAASGLGNISGQDKEIIKMTIGQDGVHCGSREIADYGTASPLVLIGTGDLVPKGIYSPANRDFIHGLNLIFQLPSESDLKIRMGGRLNYIDEANRTDDIKVYMNNQFVDYWNPYDGKESSQERVFLFEIPARYTRAGLNKLLLTTEHLPQDVNIYYGFSTITLENDLGRTTVGMEEPNLGPALSSSYNTTIPTYTIGEPSITFPERLLSEGYTGMVHGVKVKFNLTTPESVLLRMNCWAWKDDNNRNDDIKVSMNGAEAGFWDPYSGKQYYGNKTFLYEVPSKYTRAGTNELTLSMEHLEGLTLTWYAIYKMELEVEQPISAAKLEGQAEALAEAQAELSQPKPESKPDDKGI